MAAEDQSSFQKLVAIAREHALRRVNPTQGLERRCRLWGSLELRDLFSPDKSGNDLLRRFLYVRPP
jgi:hypothetical protein